MVVSFRSCGKPVGPVACSSLYAASAPSSRDCASPMSAVEPMALNRAALNTTLCLNPSLAARVRLMPVALGTVAPVAVAHLAEHVGAIGRSRARVAPC